jgi:dihydrofolate reductase
MTRSVDTFSESPPVSIILAQDADNGVGYKSKLPWEDSPYKNDMKMFRELTTGKPGTINAVVMGYTTWRSIPMKFRPLKNRVNIVLTVNHYDEMVSEGQSEFVFRCWEDLKDHLVNSVYDRLWVIGGADVYEGVFQNLRVSNIYRTRFNKKHVCDKFIDIDGLIAKHGLDSTTKVIRDDDDGRVDLITITGQKEDCQ